MPLVPPRSLYFPSPPRSSILVPHGGNGCLDVGVLHEGVDPNPRRVHLRNELPVEQRGGIVVEPSNNQLVDRAEGVVVD